MDQNQKEAPTLFTSYFRILNQPYVLGKNKETLLVSRNGQIIMFVPELIAGIIPNNGCGRSPEQISGPIKALKSFCHFDPINQKLQKRISKIQLVLKGKISCIGGSLEIPLYNPCRYKPSYLSAAMRTRVQMETQAVTQMMYCTVRHQVRPNGQYIRMQSLAVAGTQTSRNKRSATARFRISRLVVFFIWGLR